MRREEFDKVRVLLLNALEQGDLDDSVYLPFALQSLGFAWRTQEQFEQALNFFTEYIRTHSDSVDAYSQRAATFWYTAQQDKAIQDYSRGLELRADDIPCLLGRAQVYCELGKHEQAERDLEAMFKALESVPPISKEYKEWKQTIEGFGRNCRAVLLASAGNLEKALSEFDASIGLAPENAWVYFNRAQAWESHGGNESALLDYELSLSKTGPKLCPWKREHAERRLRELGI